MTVDTLPQIVDIVQIYDLLYRLGVTANYTGFFHASYAVYLAVQQQDRLLLVTKWLYPEVARHYKTSWNCVERNIRTVSSIAWQMNRPLLEELARRPLPRRPTASAFLAVLTAYFNSSFAA